LPITFGAVVFDGGGSSATAVDADADHLVPVATLFAPDTAAMTHLPPSAATSAYVDERAPVMIEHELGISFAAAVCREVHLNH
jgi:hypothetical protein